MIFVRFVPVTEDGPEETMTGENGTFNQMPRGRDWLYLPLSPGFARREVQ